jgi:hypothetical protein
LLTIWIEIILWVLFHLLHLFPLQINLLLMFNIFLVKIDKLQKKIPRFWVGKFFELGFLLFKHDLRASFHLMLIASWMVISQYLNIWKLKQISLLILVFNFPTNLLVSFILWTYIQQFFWNIEKHAYIENHLGHGID